MKTSHAFILIFVLIIALGLSTGISHAQIKNLDPYHLRNPNRSVS